MELGGSWLVSLLVGFNLGGTEDGSFPLGFALYGLGFLANVSVAVFWPDKSEEFEEKRRALEESSFSSTQV